MYHAYQLLNRNHTATLIILTLAVVAWTAFAAAVATCKRPSFFYRHSLPALAMLLLASVSMATVALLTYASPKAAVFVMATILAIYARHRLSEIAVVVAVLTALGALNANWAAAVPMGVAYAVAYFVHRITKSGSCMAESLTNLSLD